MFAAAYLPTLLGLLAWWLGRPRDVWAVFAIVLGVLSIVPAVYCLKFSFEEDGTIRLFYSAAIIPLLLGLWVCA